MTSRPEIFFLMDSANVASKLNKQNGYNIINKWLTTCTNYYAQSIYNKYDMIYITNQLMQMVSMAAVQITVTGVNACYFV